MSKYFNYFPKTIYQLSDNTVDSALKITSRFNFEQSFKDNSAVAYEYDIQDGDTPEIIANKLISISPNPVFKNTLAEISLTGFLPMESVELILEDILGKRVFSVTQTIDKDGTLAFLLNADFPAGEYLLVYGNSFLVKKLIIK